MQLFQRSLHQLVLSVVGISLSLPLAQTVQATPAQQVRHFCYKNDSVFAAAETKNFWVSICGGDLPHTYVGVNKSTGQTIRLPLSVNGVDSKGTYFEAVNGEYTYILADSAKGKNLTVSRGTRELLREPVIRGW